MSMLDISLQDQYAILFTVIKPDRQLATPWMVMDCVDDPAWMVQHERGKK